MLGIILALTASIAWGGADFLGGLTTRRIPLLRVLTISQAAGLVALVVIVVARKVPLPQPASLEPAVLAGVCVTVGLTALYRALAVGVMSVVAPIAATSAVIPVVVGIGLGDRPSTVQVMGTIAALFGVIMAVCKSNDDRVAERRIAGGAGLALVAAVAFGGFFVALHGSHGDLFWVMLVQRSTTVTLLLVAALAVAPGLVPQSRDTAPLILIGLLDAGATTLFIASSRLGMLSVVSVVASLYPVATIVLAQLILGEKMSRFQRMGVGLALIGIALIAV